MRLGLVSYFLPLARFVFFLALVNVASTQVFAADYRIMVLGDSLSAGYGLDKADAFPEQLGVAIREKGHAVSMINAGVSGDTSKGGLARLNWALADNPDMVIVELGANDGLRGLDPMLMKDNLSKIIQNLKDRNIKVLLAGMYAPPNFGEDYGKAFNAVYPALAKEHDIALYPFFLEGVAGIPTLNLEDGIHPTAKGIAEIVKRILPYVIKVKEKG